MHNLHEIACASPRIESLHFGVADYTASTQARTVNIGGANTAYHVLTDPDEHAERGVHWGDMWHYAIARIVVAARANGLRPAPSATFRISRASQPRPDAPQHSAARENG